MALSRVLPHSFASLTRRSKKSGYYYKELSKGSILYNRALDIWRHFENKRTADNLLIDKIIAIYNPILVKNFVGGYRFAIFFDSLTFRIALSRNKEEIFTQRRWQNELETKNQRVFIHDQFEKMCLQFTWNKPGGVHIIPQLHGTGNSGLFQIFNPLQI